MGCPGQLGRRVFRYVNSKYEANDIDVVRGGLDARGRTVGGWMDGWAPTRQLFQ